MIEKMLFTNQAIFVEMYNLKYCLLKIAQQFMLIWDLKKLIMTSQWTKKMNYDLSVDTRMDIV